MIELLIILVVLATLAAIAVPNFLEAQIRSKVARTHVDMAAIAYAMRAYNADNGSYPPNMPAVQEALVGLSALPPGQTSETLLQETHVRLRNAADYDRIPGAHHAGYLEALLRPVNYLGAIPLDGFGHNRAAPLPTFNLQDLPREPLRRAFGFQPPFAVLSAGPDLSLDKLNLANGSVTLFDPTNGTVSRGDILMLGSQLARQTTGMLAVDPLPIPQSHSYRRFGREEF
jgi:type II secretory pathway pseudopilin PulG